MTSTFFQRLLIIILLAGTIPTLWAQEYKYEIGGMAGGAFYMGDANKNTIFKGMNPAVGAVFRYNINFRWALKANLMWGQVSGKTEGMENVFPNNAQTSFNRSIMELGGQAEFNFFPYSDKFDYAGAKRFSPYVLVGIGLTVAPDSCLFSQSTTFFILLIFTYIFRIVTSTAPRAEIPCNRQQQERVPIFILKSATLNTIRIVQHVLSL